MKKITTLLFFFLVFSSGKSQSQFFNVLISPTGCTEPSICIDPTNTNRIVAATNCAYSYYSADAGLSWDTCQNDTISRGQWAYDACIVADYSGNFYYFHNCFVPAPTVVTVQKSFNGGQHWTFNNNVPDLYDKEMVCVRPSTNELYATYIPSPNLYNVGYSKSSDGAVTWTPVTYVNQQTYNGYQWGAAPAVGKLPGQLYVVWENILGVYFQKSSNDGATWMTFDMQIRPFFSDSNGYNCMPSIACDLSNGPYQGYLYITWWELDTTNTDTDIYFAKSTDGGTTWNITSIASDISTNQKWPQITVDPVTGYVYIVYYNQNNPATYYDIRLLFSFDGGSTFLNVPVSVTPATVTNWYHHYIGNSAYNGVIRPAWTTNDSLYTAIVSQVQLMQWLSTQEYDITSAINIYPNPSYGIFNINSADAGTVNVINSTGEIVYQSTIESLNYSTIDLTNQPTGLYLVTLHTKKGIVTRRIIKM
jgi:hypothetical protein